MAERAVKNSIIIAAALLLLAGMVFGQTTSASLSGTVHDPSGAAVPGASIKVINTRTNLSFETISSGEGNFYPFRSPAWRVHR